jgi:predicted nucleotidyltransferase
MIKKAVTKMTEFNNVLLKTVHGSHLYGIAHPDSDDDRYVVADWTTRSVRHKLGRPTIAQTIEGNDDTTFTDYVSFMRLVENGVPQALEALFSRKAEVNNIDYMSSGWKANSAVTHERYMKTLKAFAAPNKTTVKYRRHAVRLAFNLEELFYTGSFNPTLTSEQKKVLFRIGDMEWSKFLHELKSMLVFEGNFNYK